MWLWGNQGLLWFDVYVDRLSGPPKLKREGDSGDEEEAANKVEMHIAFSFHYKYKWFMLMVCTVHYIDWWNTEYWCQFLIYCLIDCWIRLYVNYSVKHMTWYMLSYSHCFLLTYQSFYLVWKCLNSFSSGIHILDLRIECTGSELCLTRSYSGKLHATLCISGTTKTPHFFCNMFLLSLIISEAYFNFSFVWWCLLC